MAFRVIFEEPITILFNFQSSVKFSLDKSSAAGVLVGRAVSLQGSSPRLQISSDDLLLCSPVSSHMGLNIFQNDT